MAENKGIFVLSLDTELAWGSFDLGLTQNLLRDFANTRSCIDGLLVLLKKYRLAATFAMVGHLMLDNCSAVDCVKHNEIIRPTFKWYEKDWFTKDPASSLDQDPIWYGTDILKKLLNAEPKQEIGSHSFCHMIFGDEGCSEASAESDIRECVKAADAHSIDLKTFIFPRNSIGHRDILIKYGFTAYRGKGNEWFNSIKNRKLRQLCHLLDNFLGIAPKTSKLIKDELGLFNTTGNMLYLSRSGIRRLIPISSRVRKAKKGINRAIKRGEVFHMWLHPYNLASDPKGLLGGMEIIFNYVREKIDQGLLENFTVHDLCMQYESFEQLRK